MPTSDKYTPPAGRKYLFVEDLVRITGIPATTWQKWRSLKKRAAIQEIWQARRL